MTKLMRSNNDGNGNEDDGEAGKHLHLWVVLRFFPLVEEVGALEDHCDARNGLLRVGNGQYDEQQSH